MIPYIEIPGLHIWGPFTVQPFGVMVVIAVSVGSWLIRRRGTEAGFTDDEMVSCLYWGLGFAFVISHMFEIVFYQTDKLMAEGPIALFKVWDGLSSMGGFLGALIGFSFYWLKVAKYKSWLEQSEFIVQGLVIGWVFGRVGCSIVHDHPGAFTDFFLGVKYPEGTRHDLGLYEMMLTSMVLTPVVLALHRFKPPKGSYIAAVCLIYAPARFGMDFLRVQDVAGADPRYFGLTMGHWGSVAIGAAGVWALVHAIRNPNDRHLPVEEKPEAERPHPTSPGKGDGKAKGGGKGKKSKSNKKKTS